MKNNRQRELVLSDMQTSKAIVKLAVPATLALLAKAVYNIVDTVYIGLLDSDVALAAVGVTLPILLIMVSIENIFAAGAAVLAGRQLGAGDQNGACETVTTIVGISVIIGNILCMTGIIFMKPMLRSFGASDTVLPEAKDYAFWMFVAALAKISSVAVSVGAGMNILLDPVFMFEWGLGMGVEGASLATTVSQFITFFILTAFYLSGHSVIKIKKSAFKPSFQFIKDVALIGIPTAVIQICLAVATSLTNIAAKSMEDADLIIAAYGVVQRLILIGCYMVMGFMQGYQPIASYAFGAKNKERFEESVKFSFKISIMMTVIIAFIYILLSRPLVMLFNRNPAVISYGVKLLISQVILYPAFGICYMMTITFQTIGSANYGLFLSTVRQGIFYVPFILTLPSFLGVTGIYLAQPAADVLTLAVCIFSYKRMKEI